MKIIRYLLLAIPFFCAVQLSHGADENGNFMIGGGVGGEKCPQFVASMEKGRLFGIGTLGYATETQGYVMYLLGFQTGYNMSTSDTYDIFARSRIDYELLYWIENYCRKNPSDRYGDAVVALARALYPKRQKMETK